MHLTSHTDFAIRTLMVLGVCAPKKVRTSEIGGAFQISEHHLVKVIQNLARHGYVETIRGKEGGVRLARSAKEINLGQVVRDLETDLGVVPCLQKNGEECFITPVCELKGVLKRATDAFLQELDQVTLDQLLKGVGRGHSPLKKRFGTRLEQLVSLGSG